LINSYKYCANPRYIDLVIPRGSNSLVTYVKSHTHIPVLGHADGICSVFIDGSADLDMCVDVVVDGKVNYPAACNATEKVLIVSRVGAPDPSGSARPEGAGCERNSCELNSRNLLHKTQTIILTQ
jgi:gamma-glutamyl phosphate reductase